MHGVLQIARRAKLAARSPAPEAEGVLAPQHRSYRSLILAMTKEAGAHPGGLPLLLYEQMSGRLHFASTRKGGRCVCRQPANSASGAAWPAGAVDADERSVAVLVAADPDHRTPVRMGEKRLHARLRWMCAAGGTRPEPGSDSLSRRCLLAT